MLQMLKRFVGKCDYSDAECRLASLYAAGQTQIFAFLTWITQHKLHFTSQKFNQAVAQVEIM